MLDAYQTEKEAQFKLQTQCSAGFVRPTSFWMQLRQILSSHLYMSSKLQRGDEKMISEELRSHSLKRRVH